jgi:HAMP domain-containing protein
MTLIGKLINTIDIIQLQHRLIGAQREKIAAQKDQIQRMRLEHTREIQGVVCGWLISCETPEIDMRDELVQLETALGHQIAKLEEHVL